MLASTLSRNDCIYTPEILFLLIKTRNGKEEANACSWRGALLSEIVESITNKSNVKAVGFLWVRQITDSSRLVLEAWFKLGMKVLHTARFT